MNLKKKLYIEQGFKIFFCYDKNDQARVEGNKILSKIVYLKYKLD